MVETKAIAVLVLMDYVGSDRSLVYLFLAIKNMLVRIPLVLKIVLCILLNITFQDI